ncbi:type II CAAX endopeptidase family protein [uncultured Psychroserpens sp.]|uniref:CPBP family intramembrane glutamic endopeptidase n=1 Tax=uncultured Psychroserpens sp. TaxID=255436 RepID=UPI00262C002A|nr:type II CAAX endopeptidase family protein [uncultured Psychroserpens sp.]
MIKLEKNVWLYIGLVFLFTYAFQIITITNSGKDFALHPLFIGLTMFFPGIGSIIYLVKTKQGLKYINWNIGKIKFIVLSLILPILFTLLGILIFEYTGLASNNVFLIDNGKVHSIEIFLILGTNEQGIPFFLLNFFVTGIMSSLIMSLLAIGEEIGWRGFLQKKLLERNSLFASLTFLGLLWGFWHFPLVINGFNYPEYPVLGAFLILPLTTVFISYFFGWLTINSKSVWPAVFAHGALNSVMIFLFEMDFGNQKLEGNFSNLGLWIIIGMISFYLIVSKKTSKNEV